MKLLNIQKIAFTLTIVAGLTSIGASANAQSCSGGTTTISSVVVNVSPNPPFDFSVSNTCLNVTNLGSYTDTQGDAISHGGATTGNIITNAGSILGGAAGYGIIQYSATPLASVINTGTISSTAYSAIYNDETITNINNSGSIAGATSGSEPYGIENITNAFSHTVGTITTLTNTGSITGTYGIYNTGIIGTLNNGQGGNSSSAPTTALNYYGALPTNYNIIITSATHYGQLAVTGASGTTTFGISSLSGTGSGIRGTYASVLTGVTNTQLGLSGTSTTGTSNGYGYTLTETGSGTNIWNLLISSVPVLGPSTADTQQSLVNTATALQGTFTLQNAVLANSFAYDCNVFGANDVCVSAGGRNTAVSAANGLNNTSALLIAGYRLSPNYRIGAYADQNLSVNNAGSTVNLGNNTPLLGLFGAWNERLDGTGTEVKVSAAYGQKNTTITRAVVGTSEAGSGSSSLNSQGAQVAAKYGYVVADNTIVSPYVGIRYTQNNMGGYTEAASSAVTAPLTYSALNTNATTVLAGVGAQYKGIPQTTLFASAGVESDTNTQNGSINATGVAGLTPVNFNANPVKTRPTATIGAYYDVEKNQRLGITGIYRQEPYQAVSTTTVMATYTVGL